MRHTYQRLGVRRVLGSDDEDHRCVLGEAQDRRLSVRGRVAKVALPGGLEQRVALPGIGEDSFPFEQTERGLGEQSDLVRVGGFECAKAVDGIDECRSFWRFGDRADRLVVPLVADVDDVVSAVGHAPHLVVDLGHERTHGVDRDRGPALGGRDDLGRRSVGGEHDRSAVRYVGYVVDEDHAGAFERVDHGGVVDDLVIAVHRWFEGLNHPRERLDRHLDACAEATRLGQQHLGHHAIEDRGHRVCNMDGYHRSDRCHIPPLLRL